MQKKPTACEIEAAAKRVQELIRKYQVGKWNEDERKVTNEDYQIGDILQVSCASAPAQVVDISHYYMWVDWPREKKIDPDSKYGWIGLEAFPIDPDSDEWLEGLFYTDPLPHHLTVGDTCLVSILRLL
jgi:hypothetical protein